MSLVLPILNFLLGAGVLYVAFITSGLATG
jgi:hypothetical protein